MGLINLADAKVSYEGQTLPAINLISKLQTQLREAACRIATIAETLGDLQVALLNSHTIEVRLTLSKEDYDSFKSMEGMDDNERIRKAIMTLIHQAESGISGADIKPKPAATVVASTPAPPPIEPAFLPAPEHQPVEKTLQEQSVTTDPVIKKTPTIECPTCHSPIALPETLNDRWLVELKCGACGAKCLMKPSLSKLSANHST